ncbi:unnamed protein product [Eruca vesicaria subsp. sativa]|uniref:Uncharacterized protein n=1 Tax=Eruca vesicaria subsp. sativa TaxID=29727 RepID=A0ABC8JMG8_ERUVS|nr:unnamed protein product [Eruca vesicaria subsp. sativa]
MEDKGIAPIKKATIKPEGSSEPSSHVLLSLPTSIVCLSTKNPSGYECEESLLKTPPATATKSLGGSGKSRGGFAWSKYGFVRKNAGYASVKPSARDSGSPAPNRNSRISNSRGHIEHTCCASGSQGEESDFREWIKRNADGVGEYERTRGGGGRRRRGSGGGEAGGCLGKS